MSAETPEVLEEQQRACIFCQIVAGKVPSKKVFENERFIAILDIRPATMGHVVLLPKDHVPLLPLLPEERLRELFTLATELGGAVKDALLAQYVTVFVANGYAAGQQAPHLLVHLLPREPGDGLDTLDVEGGSVAQADALALAPLFRGATAEVLRRNGHTDLLTPEPAAPPQTPVVAPTVSPAPASERVQDFADADAALQTVLATNADLRRLIIAEPTLVEEYISKSEKLKQLFANVNIRALSLVLRRQDEAKGAATRTAASMTDAELFAFIDGNEGLRTWLTQHPEEFALNLHSNPRLQAFFANVDVLELAHRYRKYKEGA